MVEVITVWQSNPREMELSQKNIFSHLTCFSTFTSTGDTYNWTAKPKIFELATIQNVKNQYKNPILRLQIFLLSTTFNFVISSFIQGVSGGSCESLYKDMSYIALLKKCPSNFIEHCVYRFRIKLPNINSSEEKKKKEIGKST